MAVLFKNISFGYERKIFDDFNYHFNRETISCIYGLNGTGKSTLIAMLAGLIKPQKGEIVIEKGMKTGFVLQFPENLVYTDSVYNEIFSIVKSSEITENIIKTLNLDEVRDINPFKLSDGQKRVMFICSILMCNDLCIFDEPFTSIDKETKKNIKEMFSNFKNKKKTIIYTTNRKFDTDIADFVLELK